MTATQRLEGTIVRRFGAAVCATLVIVSSFTLTPTTASAADADIKVVSIQDFGPDSSGSREIVGEVQNIGPAPIGSVRIDFGFYSADNTLLSTDFTFASVDRLATSERSPFRLSFDPVAGYDHYEYAVSDSEDSFRALNHNFSVSVTNRFNDGFFEHVVGTVRNNNTSTAEFVSVVGTVYGSTGTAVDAAETFINNNSKELAPGTSATFELIFFGQRAFQDYALLAQSSSAPSTPAESPSPSSTGVPAASPAGSPSASPVSSPSVSSPPAVPNEVPSVSVAPFVVKFGQTANVTITGTPGATVDLFIRKFRSDFLKIRDGLVLDSNGRITVPTKPDMNLRFLAKDRTVDEGSSIGGTDGLMTVEKNISINVARVGVRRYTFSGSINPMHPGAVVNLYRNGTLIKSGIPVNSSRVYSFTGTFAAGTFNFDIRSPVTGYNNASRSPLKSVRIS